MTFTTTAFDRSGSWLFEASPYRTAPKGPPSSFVQHGAFAPSWHNLPHHRTHWAWSRRCGQGRKSRGDPQHVPQCLPRMLDRLILPHPPVNGEQSFFGYVRGQK